MGYWPSYSEIPPACRTAYLHWLAGGRSAPQAYIGYVFLFFYGLERRVLVDAQTSAVARAEIGTICEEVARLLAVYSDNASFRAYGTAFQDVIELLYREIRIEELQPPLAREGWDVPFSCKVALGIQALNKQPLSGPWALGWLLTSPNTWLRTPAQRCPEEFRELYLLRYQERYGQGIQLPRIRTALRCDYRPASSSFGSSLSLKIGDLPDITHSTATLEKLSRLAEETCQELDAFSRWVGRTGEPRSLAGVALLPEVLARSRGGSAGEEFSNWLNHLFETSEFAAIPSEQLLEHWPREKENSFFRREQETLSRFLASRQVGYEPDVSQGGTSLGKTKWVVLFRFPGCMSDPLGPNFQAATLLLHLAAVVARSDGQINAQEEQLLAEHLDHGLNLSPLERVRLQAHLRWLLAEPPKLTGIKKRVETLDEGHRRFLGAFLITVAGADGHLAPGELDALTKIYTLLGLDSQSVFTEVHQLMSSEAPAPEGPVPVRLAGSAPSRFAIPSAQTPPAEERKGVRLDQSKVQAKLAETERVAEILDDIFMGDESEHPSAERASVVLTDDFAIAGLDAAHSALLLRLAGQPIWQRGSIERLTSMLGLMPEGALEVINEAAFTACDAPLIEGDETIEIDVEVLRRMLS